MVLCAAAEFEDVRPFDMTSYQRLVSVLTVLRTVHQRRVGTPICAGPPQTKALGIKKISLQKGISL